MQYDECCGVDRSLVSCPRAGYTAAEVGRFVSTVIGTACVLVLALALALPVISFVVVFYFLSKFIISLSIPTLFFYLE